MERIVVTGYGVKVPGASNSNEFKHLLENGVCSLEVLSGYGPNNTDVIGGVIQDDFMVIRDRNYKRYPRVSRLAMAAADEAMGMASFTNIHDLRTTIFMGTSAGSALEFEKYSTLINTRDYRKFPLCGAGLANTHSLSVAVASHLDVKGQAFTLTTGCTAGVDTLIMAKLLLQNYQTDVCIVGGADSPITIGCIYSFSKIGSLSKNQDIDTTGIPFSTDSKGFALAEGAGILVLERESDAVARGANIYGVIDRVCSNNDGLSIFESDTTGKNMTTSLKTVLGDEVPTFVNSQALGLKLNDSVDYIAHSTLLGDSVPITSIKGMIGHSFGAAGIVQAISSLISIEHSFIPPTIKTNGVGYPGLPIVFDKQSCPVDRVAITSHGYGGNNTCVMLSKFAG